MKKKLLSLIVIACMLLTSVPLSATEAVSQSGIQGTLMIVGGAMESTNSEIYNKFIELAGGKENAVIGIIPAASGSPTKYYEQFQNELAAYGLNKDKAVLIPIAVRDEKGTKNVDESKWIENVNKPETANLIKGCTGIWFVGGDQTRITKALYNPDGTNTLALDAIWEIYRNGAVVGGTSAGAAIMSETMIAGGSSLGALNNGFTTVYTDSDQQEYGPAYIEKGLGFFPYGIVDQHFDRKARLGRLVVVGYANKDRWPVSYGVDENTGMVVYNTTKTIEVVGDGGVTILDFSNAEKDNRFRQMAVENVDVSYLETGDKFNMVTKTFDINSKKFDTRDYEYYEIPGPIINTGIMSPNGLWKKFVGFDLVDNFGIDEVKSYSFDNQGRGVEIVFRKTEKSNGWWAYLRGGTNDYYSITNVALDIHPVKVKILPVVPEYVVKKGDVLHKIAEQFDTTLEKLMELNGLKNAGQIKEGQVLKIPQD